MRDLTAHELEDLGYAALTYLLRHSKGHELEEAIEEEATPKRARRALERLLRQTAIEAHTEGRAVGYGECMTSAPDGLEQLVRVLEDHRDEVVPPNEYGEWPGRRAFLDALQWLKGFSMQRKAGTSDPARFSVRPASWHGGES